MASPSPSVFWTDNKLDRLFDATLDSATEIKEAFDKLEPARRRRVRASLRAQPSRIVESTRAEQSSYEASLAALAKAESEAAAVPVTVPAPLRVPRTLATWSLYGLTAALLVVWPISGFFIGWSTPWSWLFRQGGWWGIGLLALAVLALLVATGWLDGRINRLKADARERARQYRFVSDRQTEVSAAEDQLQQAGAQAALRAWRSQIANELKPIYSVQMRAAGSGAEVSGTEREMQVRTPARAEMTAMLSNMRGGSIGIAGPRGAGKSTLMAWFCSNDAVIEGKNPTLAVSLSAPVDYQTRDFLLHLFASLCHRALEKTDPHYVAHDWKKQVTQAAPQNGDVWQVVFTGAVVAMLAGAVLVLASVFWALDAVEPPTGAPSALAVARAAASAPLPVPGAASAPLPVPGAASAVASGAARVAGSAASSEAVRSATPAGSAAVTAARADAAASAPAPKSVARELGLSPAVLFTASLALTVGAGLLVVLLSTFAARTQATARQDDRQQASGPPSDPEPWPIRAYRQPVRWYRSVYAGLRPQNAVRASPIAEEALRWLAEIKFQQSYSTGWSGALKMPMGLEGTVNQARSMAQQQLSMPEIADATTGFLRTLGRHYTVVVGIDELDKIESDEKAQKFLNDIKVVFGGLNVYFLVSVSENAMSQFERRGLPFRDAFDSAFDDIVVVDHLTFEDTQRLINERVLRMPMQFQALCHVLSAGLPRELVRTARDLVLAVNGNASPLAMKLEDVTRLMVHGELKSKVLAFTAAAENLAASPGRDRFMLLTEQVVTARPPTPQLLFDTHEALLNLVAVPRRTGHRSTAPTPADQALKALGEEFATYLYFLAAVGNVFVNTLGAIEMAKLEAAGLVDSFARARSLQGKNQALARRMICELLEKLGRPLSPGLHG